MKKFTPSFLLLLLPFYFLAQNEDYCPCMETQNPYDDIMYMASMVKGKNFDLMPPNFQLERSSSIIIEIEQREEDLPEDLPDDTPIDLDEPENDLELDKTEKETKAVSTVNKSSFKKLKKKSTKRLKSRKKIKKYKGKCPLF